MAQVGPAADLLLVDEYRDEGLWHLVVDESTVLFAELDARRSLLVLSAEIASFPPERRLELFDLIMRYNHAWDASGGARLSVDGSEDKLWLLEDLGIETLDLDRLMKELSAFVMKQSGWREIVDKFSNGDAENDELLEVLSTPGLIRS